MVQIDGAEFGLPGHTLTLKLELLQHSGSFKARGAFANLLTRDVPQAGVVAASGGNHGAAVAYAAMKLGKPAKIFVPSVSSAAKVQRIRDYGADLTIEGDRYADALAASEAWAQQTGALPVPAFDQNETIVGQGTLGLELADQAPDIDTLLVSVGGGGLVAGLAAWYAGRIKVIGVEPLASPTLTRAFEAGHPVDAEAGGLAADSLAPRRVGERVFPIVQKHARQTVRFPTPRSPTRRRRFGAPCASWQNRVARQRSRRSCRAPTGLARANGLRSSSAAATQPLLISIAPVDCRQIATELQLGSRVLRGPGCHDAPPHLESL
jgi:threonine dehydratase